MDTLEWIIRAAGIGHFAVAAASVRAPAVLDWKSELAQLRPLNRQIFTTYAGYILTINLLFGIVSVAAPGLLLDGTPLAAIVCGFIFAYWFARIVLQFAYYDASDKPDGLRFVIAEWCFVGMFLFFNVAFAWALVANLEMLL